MAGTVNVGSTSPAASVEHSCCPIAVPKRERSANADFKARGASPDGDGGEALGAQKLV